MVQDLPSLVKVGHPDLPSPDKIGQRRVQDAPSGRKSILKKNGHLAKAFKRNLKVSVAVSNGVTASHDT